ncbi:putative receptor protein kinase ZmPK1 [Rutidosis leptorrhynchoides]|uniref:putative receptor protein kinase ZmPK1 n=1 Tax=Rutidosis leptorrhynchoides TaxID=125765 RepID=UPI003A99F8A6
MIIHISNFIMHNPCLVILIPLITFSCSSQFVTATSSNSSNVLTQASSLAVEKQTYLVSPNRVFTAGFHQTGQNAYFFAIWFTELISDGSHTLVWMANRDAPVNGKHSSFSLTKTGNLVLTDAGQKIWTSNTKSTLSLQLQLLDSGNLVLTQIDTQSYLWQSFDFPTDTLLPNQPFTKDTFLVSSRSLTNFSSGFYTFFFDNDNVIRLLYNNDVITSVYWPKPWLLTWDSDRSTFNSSRIALLDSRGRFGSSDNYTFVTSDYGLSFQRRMTLDVDGNVRVYTLNNRNWIVSLQTISSACNIHGSCGVNSVCTYSPEFGRGCTCLHGYKVKNQSDLSLGCDPTFDFTKNQENYGFIKFPHTEFYGFDSGFVLGLRFQDCKNLCLNNSECKAFQYYFDKATNGFKCSVKTLLFNGHNMDASFVTYLKLPMIDVLSFYHKVVKQESGPNCSSSIVSLKRTYNKNSASGSLNFLLWFSIILGAIEVTCFLVFCYSTKRSSRASTQKYLAIATGFRRFTYDEITKATQNFKDEIGRGGGGIVYKGVLRDNRVVAVKRLHQVNQGEAEFLAEMSTIGRINHKNLIETYGYCAERKHRILVYEYMENGSLATKLGTNELDWQKMLAIATGVAKGLAYLHEECLEWVLHCDVKPHNILLDVDYNPKVADFGLSKLFHQDAMENSMFSRIRGTRGYMAPEWVFNLPITSKVDVYSYGMVVLEMILGKNHTFDQEIDGSEGMEQKEIVSRLKEKVNENGDSLTETLIKDILDPTMMDEYESSEMKKLLKVALQCVEENKDLRPTMSEVVKMLLD